MMIYLAITGNLPSWASFLTPLLKGAEWVACLIGASVAVASLGMTGVHWMTHRHDWGAVFLGILGAVAGLGFAGGAVAAGTAIAGTVLVR